MSASKRRPTRSDREDEREGEAMQRRIAAFLAECERDGLCSTCLKPKHPEGVACPEEVGFPS